MNYKSKHSDPPVWTLEEFDRHRRPEPYDIPTGGELLEFDAPNQSTIFLAGSCLDKKEEFDCSLYAVEAPPHCPMRQAFEWGEISWMEFFTEREWLLQMFLPLNAIRVVSRYISPREIGPETRGYFEAVGGQFPYELKRRQLEMHCDKRFMDAGDTTRAEREYRAFMRKYGHRFAKRAE